MTLIKCDRCGCDITSVIGSYRIGIGIGTLYSDTYDICDDCKKVIRETIENGNKPSNNRTDRLTKINNSYIQTNKKLVIENYELKQEIKNMEFNKIALYRFARANKKLKKKYKRLKRKYNNVERQYLTVTKR